MLESIYDDLPDDDKLTFLKLEAAYRKECENAVFDAQKNAPTLFGLILRSIAKANVARMERSETGAGVPHCAALMRATSQLTAPVSLLRRRAAPQRCCFEV